MISKNEIKSQLESLIEEHNKKFDIINKIIQEKRIATKDELDVINAPEEPLGTPVIALILEDKVIRRNKKGEENDFVIIDNKLDRALVIDKIDKQLSQKEPFKYNMILKHESNVHCTPVHLDFDGTNFKIFGIDASADHTNFDTIRAMSTLLDKKGILNIYDLGGIQSDNFNCSIFSIDHISKMSKLSSDELDNSIGKNLSDLSPKMITRSQSYTSLDQYLQEHYQNNDERNELKDKLERQSIVAQINSNDTKMMNKAIDYKRHKYLINALTLLENLNDNEFQELLEKRTGKEIFKEEKKEERFRDIISHKTKQLLEYIDQLESAPNIKYINSLIDLGANPLDILQYDIIPKRGTKIYLNNQLSKAISNGNKQYVIKLIAAGAEVIQDIKDNKNALELAKESGNEGIISIISDVIDQKIELANEDKKAVDIYQLIKNNITCNSKGNPLYNLVENTKSIKYIKQVDTLLDNLLPNPKFAKIFLKAGYNKPVLANDSLDQDLKKISDKLFQYQVDDNNILTEVKSSNKKSINMGK